MRARRGRIPHGAQHAAALSTRHPGPAHPDRGVLTIQCLRVHRRLAMNTVPSSDTILQFTDVALGYGDFTVLSGISLEARKGQVVALMGGSGSGKTTLLRAATAQIVAQRGRVTAFGQDIAQLSGEELRKLRQRMGVLFQQGALFTDLNVFEN